MLSTKKLKLSVAVMAALGAPTAFADAFSAGDLLLTSSLYQGNSATVSIGQTLPGGGASTAVANGSYPNVFNNAVPDPSFGVTSSIYLNEITTSGAAVQSLNLTTLSGGQLVTSFPSKSELSINLSTDGKSVTLMGYVAQVNQLDVSNSNTPGHVDSTNPVGLTNQRAVAQVDFGGNLIVSPVNAYSGNNGRAAILANNVNGTGASNVYLVGNAGNSGKTPAPTAAQLDMLSQNTGVQLIASGSTGDSTVVGQHQGSASSSTGNQYGFSVTQTGVAADKTGKDNNYRGETIFNNTLFVTKGSGGNGINTVYQVGTTGQLPTAADASSTQINILPGFNTTLAATATTGPNPFGLWFANDHTLYVADEGDGKAADAGTSTFAGLEKWVLSDTDGLWHNVYTLQSGLNLGQNYDVTGGLNADGSVNPNGTGQTYTAATDGLRNITGLVNADGTVTIYGITSTVSTSGDQGADPNKLVAITDNLTYASFAQASGETFSTLKTAQYGEVLRGVSFAPTVSAVPVPAAVWLFGSAVAGISVFGRRKRPA